MKISNYKVSSVNPWTIDVWEAGERFNATRTQFTVRAERRGKSAFNKPETVSLCVTNKRPSDKRFLDSVDFTNLSKQDIVSLADLFNTIAGNMK